MDAGLKQRSRKSTGQSAPQDKKPNFLKRGLQSLFCSKGVESGGSLNQNVRTRADDQNERKSATAPPTTDHTRVGLSTLPTKLNLGLIDNNADAKK